MSTDFVILLSPVTKFIRTLFEWMSSWWRVDRICVSPRDGRLLRIAPGSILSVAGSMFEVKQRTVMDTPEGPFICYTCLGEEGPSKLCIGVRPGATILWSYDGESKVMAAEDIEVWGREQCA